ncbi:MAG: ferrous iron transport protein A [bacterium]|nr:ferrous iron transport protein A [bacterium]
MESLIKAIPGKYRIIKITTSYKVAQRRLMTLGIFEGDEIELVKSSPGPIIIEKKGTRIGIAQDLASCILVENISENKKQ